ncbi:MAG TPA: hypothetical protein VHO90_00775 [Bacteroidales bacterium]|nr:hypothetical protein [Bacteroidales bacterium]
MKYIYGLFLGVVLLFCSSCGKDSNDEPGLPEWNKEHTATIQFYSRLNQESLFTGLDYSEVTTRIKSSVQQIAVLDRADVVYSETGITNPTVSIASQCSRVPLFVADSYNESQINGTGVLIKHTLTESKSINIAPGAGMLTVATQVNTSIPLLFSTLSINNESQIETGLAAITSNVTTHGAVLVGTIDKSLADKLASRFPSKSFRFVTIESSEPNTGRLIFVLTSLKWVMRESSEIILNNTGLSCIDIKIEAL